MTSQFVCLFNRSSNLVVGSSRLCPSLQHLSTGIDVTALLRWCCHNNVNWDVGNCGACLGWIKERVWGAAESSCTRLDMATDGTNSPAGVCNAIGQGLVATVSTCDRVSNYWRETARVVAVLRSNVGSWWIPTLPLDPLWQQRSSYHQRCWRLAQQS